MSVSLSGIELPQGLEKQDDGVIMFRDHRISLHLVLDTLYSGLAVGEIHDRFPSISLPVLTRVVEFCQRRSAVMRQYHREQQAVAEKLCDDAHRGPSLEELRDRQP